MSIALDFESAGSMADAREPDHLKPGTYHVACTDIENLTNNSTGETYAFRLRLTVGNGNVAGQEGKGFWAKFLIPMKSHSDGGETANKFVVHLARATGMVPPGSSGTGTLEPGELVDMQMVIKAKEKKSKDDAGNIRAFIEIDGMNMWHIDDPEVAAIPKREDWIASVCGIRWTPEMVAVATAKHEKAVKSTAATETKKPNYRDL